MLARYAAVLTATALLQVASAQTTSLSVAQNLPNAGQDFSAMRLTTATPAAPGGMGVAFDYSGVTGGTAATYQWLDPAALPFPHAPATLALTDGGTDTIYYRDNGGLERVAERQTLLGLYTLDAGYNDGPLEVKMPLAYGDTWNDPITASFDADGNPGVRSGAIAGTADGAGWITLPGGSAQIEVLRVRTHLTETITINATLPLVITHKRHVDAYYAAWSKYPVMRTFTDTLTSNLGLTQYTAGTDWLQEASLSVAPVTAGQFGMAVFPNPANGPAELTWTADGTAATLEVFSATGAVVAKRDLGVRSGAQRIRIDTDTWTPGLYLVRLRNARQAQVLRLTVR